ncbi:MAG: AMP-dependent synthetase [Alphaproteobacteria bacterium]|nr:MAG: AMP-dependent synthetase [Alphaproteobacteria bacterium]
MTDSTHIPGADYPIWELLWANLRQRSNKICLIDPGHDISFGALATAADGLADQLRRLGIAPGDRVIVHFRKCIDEVVAMFAAWRLGAVVVNVNHQMTIDQLLFVARDCRARAAVVPAVVAHALARHELPDTLERIVVRHGGPAEDVRFSDWTGERADPGFSPENPDPGALAAIIYTSGSTGNPKGVMLSHRNIRIGALSVIDYLGLDETDRLLSVLPYSFDAGLNQLTTMLRVGGTVVHQPVTLATEIVRTAIANAVTGIAGVPTMWSMVVRYLLDAPTAFPTLRRITNTGGKITPEILEVIPQVFPGIDVYLMYGLTEAFRSTYLPPTRFLAKKGAIGQAVPHAQVHVVRHGIGPAGPGEQGELVHAGSLVSLGYWERPAETAARIRPCPELAAILADRPVVWSGDLVRIDADGDLWFVGRIDDMIKTMGFRLSPTEVEDHAARTGLVTESVAFAVEHPDMGQAVHLACVVPGETDAATLRSACRRVMPGYMIPDRFYAWAGLMPRTPSGKLDRPEIIRSCRGGHAIALV